MTINKRAVGTEYEDAACRFLESKGMRIITRNYRVKAGEIDIIAADGNELVFVEVKYRKSKDCGGAEFAIPVSKQNRIRKVALWYLTSCGLSDETFCRFDAVLIDGEEISHIKNAW